VLLLVRISTVVTMVWLVATVVVNEQPSYGQQWTCRPAVGDRFAAGCCIALADPTAVAVFPVPVRLTVLLLLMALDILLLLVLVTVVAITWSGTRNPPRIGFASTGTVDSATSCC